MNLRRETAPDPYASVLAREWFYEFELPDGRRTTSHLPAEVATIHETRLRMLEAVLASAITVGTDGLTCLDLGCHEGYYALHLARQGWHVTGVDARRENIEGAMLMRDLYAVDNLNFVHREILDLESSPLGRFDLVLMFGLLYHLENPIAALRMARTHARRLCIVESQIAPSLTGTVEWGSRKWRKPIVGSFAMVDESDELMRSNREANVKPLSLVADLAGLLHAMRSVGFSKVAVVDVPRNGNEQLRRQKRVMVVGHVTPEAI